MWIKNRMDPDQLALSEASCSVSTLFSKKGKELWSVRLKGSIHYVISISQGVCTEAGMYALRERRVHVTQEDFELAVAKVGIIYNYNPALKKVGLYSIWVVCHFVHPCPSVFRFNSKS